MKNLRLISALLLLLAHATPAAASQGSGCMPTSGTVSGLSLVQSLNAGIAALISTNSGATAPATDCSGVAVAGQLWLDTSAPTLPALKIYSGSAWLPLGVVDVSSGVWAPQVGGGTATLASATTVNLCSVPQSLISISGTTTVAGFGSSCYAGQTKDLRFTGVFQLTYNATSMLLPGAANITTAVGDYARAVYLGSGNWALIAYTRADGTAVSSTSIFTGAVFFSSAIAPSALSGNTDNWNPSGLALANTIKFSCASLINITGITAPVTDGKVLLLHNTGSASCRLTSQDANSTAGNRFALAYPVTIGGGQSFAIVYDLTAARWRSLQPIPAQPISGLMRGLTVDPGGTPNNQVTIAAVEATLEDSQGFGYRASSVSVTPDITASGANGLDTGTVTTNQTYGTYIIFNPTTNTTAGLFSAGLSCSAVTMPAGYTACALAGYQITNGSSQIRQIVQRGDVAFHKLPISSVGGTNVTNVAQSVSLTVPSGVRVEATVSGWLGAADGNVVYFYSPELTDPTVTNNVGPGSAGGRIAGSGVSTAGSVVPPTSVPTNTSAQVKYIGDAASTGPLWLFTLGWRLIR